MRIYADPEIVDLPGASAALVTPESGDRLHTYVRDAAGSIVLRDGRMIPSPP